MCIFHPASSFILPRNKNDSIVGKKWDFYPIVGQFCVFNIIVVQLHLLTNLSSNHTAINPLTHCTYTELMKTILVALHTCKV